MRQPADASRIHAVLDHLGRSTRSSVRIYLTGGATAVLHGWRATTIDVDLKLVPDSDEVLRAMPQLKEELAVNLELAAPDQFIPPLPGWEDRSLFIRQVGSVAFYHYDPYAQALAKLERGHQLDLDDARRMVREGLVETDRLLQLFSAIEPQLYRYPAIDPAWFRRAVESFTAG
jgi:uncharacterized nucleotidyltransferase DUF6036